MLVSPYPPRKTPVHERVRRLTIRATTQEEEEALAVLNNILLRHDYTWVWQTQLTLEDKSK